MQILKFLKIKLSTEYNNEGAVSLHSHMGLLLGSNTQKVKLTEGDF